MDNLGEWLAAILDRGVVVTTDRDGAVHIRLEDDDESDAVAPGQISSGW